MGIKKIVNRSIGFVKESGKMTPIAAVTAFLPMIGSAVLLTIAYPLGFWLRENWEVGSGLFLLGVVTFCGLALLPTNVLGILSGWSFGFEFGILILATGIVCAATVSFLIHSRLIGNKLPEIFANHPKAEAVYNSLVKNNTRRTALIIFLLRLSPAMPFALTNFMMASARVPVRSFVLGTFFGMLPRSSAVVFVGSGLSELSFTDPQEAWLIVFGIFATVASVVFISFVAKRALAHVTRDDEPAQSASI
ncbi:MAG: VTT domain-containing protein [Acidobacteria bacterium]|nr:VTT domain-containing protein [Acidobacteriota bacterium]